MDLRKLGILKAFSKLLDAEFTEEEKEFLRNHPEIIGNEYIVINRTTQGAKKAYPKEQQEAIDKFIKKNGFEKVEIEPAKENYKIELVPTQKAMDEVKTMLENEAKNNPNRRIATSARKVASKIAKK